MTKRQFPAVLPFAVDHWLRPSGAVRMGFISWIVLGLIAGVLAKWIMPGKDPMGWILTIFLGIGGALLGGYAGTHFGIGGLAGFSVKSVGLAVGGALVLLLVYRALRR